MKAITKKVEIELKKLGLTLVEVENENIIKACTAKIVLVDNLNKEGIDFDELEEKVYPDSTFINQMIFHLDNGGSWKDMVLEFLFKGIYYTPELQDALETPIEE